jgi:hypothetical protein
MNAEEIGEAREILQQAMEILDNRRERINKTLRESRRRMAPIRAELRRAGYLPPVKAELHAQIDAMTEEEAAEVNLVFAPDRPSNATSISAVGKRPGTTPVSPRGFDRQFGSLPADDAA